MKASHGASLVIVAAGVALTGYGVMRFVDARTLEKELHAGFVSRSSESAFELEPHLAVSGSGALAVAWMGVAAGAGAADRIGVRFSNDDGKSWGPIQAMNVPGFYAADPMLVSRADADVDLTWLAFRQNRAAGGDPYDMHVFTAGSRAGHFGAPLEVTETGGIYDKPFSIRGPKGRLMVLHRFATPSDGGFSLALANDDHTKFSRTTVVHGATFAGALGSVCAEERGVRLFVTYVDPTAGIVLRVSDDGVTWSEGRQTIVSKADDHVAPEGPLCFVRGDEVLVSYGTSATPTDTSASAILDAVVVARSDDGGKTFASRVLLRDERALLMHPQLVRALSGVLQMTYFSGKSEGDGEGAFRVMRASAPWPTRTLRSPVRFVSRRSAPAWVGDYVGLAWAGDRLYVATVDNARGTPHVVFMETATE